MSALQLSSPPDFRYSGHETFPCRYTWLPKAVRNLNEDPELFANEDTAMVRLGVGKNMVRAIRFWADAAEVTDVSPDRQLRVSSFGKAVFGRGGYDQFLEDIRTLWLIHWKLSSSVSEPLFAWHYLLNHWHRPDFTTSEALAALANEAQRMSKKLSAAPPENGRKFWLNFILKRRSAR